MTRYSFLWRQARDYFLTRLYSHGIPGDSDESNATRIFGHDVTRSGSVPLEEVEGSRSFLRSIAVPHEQCPSLK